MVSRRQGATSLQTDKSALKFNNDGSINWDTSSATVDFGLHESMESKPHRSTSMNSCSCQWPVAFGGLPCRHIIHVHTCQQSTLEDMQLILEGVLSKWVLKDDLETARCAAELRTAPTDDIGAVRFRHSQEISRKDRYRLLSQKFDAIADLGARNATNFDLVMTRLESIQQVLLEGNRSKPTSTSREPDSEPVSGCNTSHNFSDAPRGSQEANSSPSDIASLRSVLQFCFRPAPCPTQDEMRAQSWWKNLLGRFIAVKYAAKRQVCCSQYQDERVNAP